MCVTLGPLKFEGSIPTTICSTFASDEALQTSIAKARRAPRVLHFFVFQAARWYGGLRTPKKTISRMYGGRTDFCARTDAQSSAASEGTPAPPKIHRTLTIVVHLAVILGSEVVR